MSILEAGVITGSVFLLAASIGVGYILWAEGRDRALERERVLANAKRSRLATAVNQVKRRGR